MKNTFLGLATTSSPSKGIRESLSSMSGRPGTDASSPPLIEAQESSGIAISGPAAGQCLIRGDGLVGAICGRAYWANDELEEQSRKSGFATSIASACRRYGTDMLGYLRGTFSLALIDSHEQRTILAIDRMGIAQMFFSCRPEVGLVFGTNAGQLHHDNLFPARISDQAVFDYLYFHMVPSPRSIFEQQQKLRPGEYIVYADGNLTQRQYWSPEFVDSGPADRRLLEEELHDLMRNSIRRHAPDEDSGCFLSGGIDSSTISGVMSELNPPAKTFTIGFQEEGYDETSFAKITADHFQTKHNEYIVTPSDVVDILPDIAKAYDEPFGNSSVVPVYFCARMARSNGIKTLYGGDGGDELFGGNVRYVTQQIFSIYDRIPHIIRNGVIEPLALGWKGADRFLPTRKLKSYVQQAKVPMPERLETYNYFNRTPVGDILHPDFLNSIRVQSPVEALRETYFASRASTMLNRMLQLDWKFTLADNDLRKVVSMCDLAGVDVLFPFLDDDIVEFSNRVPADMKISRFRLRHFFKHSMRSYLPREVLRKTKHGFGLPFGLWMKSYQPLQELAYDCLSDIGKRNIVRREYLDELIRLHRSENAHYYGEFIWVLMALELWFKAHAIHYEVGDH